MIEMPAPQYVMSAEGFRIATYSWGDERDPTVLAVHGFASSARDNWLDTGWIRELLHAGFRVLAVDQRGHGASDKPHEPSDYSMPAMVTDLIAVLDTYLVEEAAYLGYSLGGRVGWQLMGTAPEHITHGVLGGIPDGRPLRRLDLTEARAHLDHGTPIPDAITRRYVTLASRLPSNDLRALLALAEGLRLHDDIPPVHTPPLQPTLIATGSEDPILGDSRTLAGVLSAGEFYEIPGRNHVTAPGSRDFRATGVAFLAAHL
ncbi:alpha/beta fold hydrolase [Microbacterium gorillae]|uniref:alpha/beta fold hydrolase n=1 Tax=Microbacterium gorillae TaxID=1231063 RepID=UPI0005908E89|nr:alpha/beta fold hydrolase [Microbacterium gorillae]